MDPRVKPEDDEAEEAARDWQRGFRAIGGAGGALSGAVAVARAFLLPLWEKVAERSEVG